MEGQDQTTTPGRRPGSLRITKNVPRPNSGTQALLQDRVNSHRGSRSRRVECQSAVRSSASGPRPSQPKAPPLTNFKPTPLMNLRYCPPKNSYPNGVRRWPDAQRKKKEKVSISTSSLNYNTKNRQVKIFRHDGGPCGPTPEIKNRSFTQNGR